MRRLLRRQIVACQWLADSRMPMTGKKGAMSGGGKKSGLMKSGNASSGKEGN